MIHFKVQEQLSTGSGEGRKFLKAFTIYGHVRNIDHVIRTVSFTPGVYIDYIFE